MGPKVYPISFITSFEMFHRLSASQLSRMLSGVALLMTLCWLTSLERYLGARYHVSLELALPEALADVLFAPSRWLDDRVRAGGSGPFFRVTWPSATGGSAPAAPVVKPHQSHQTPQLEDLPQPLPKGEFLPTLAQQKLLPGVQRILLAGDSMMQGVAPLLMSDLARLHPDWEVHDMSRQSTGLTVRRYFDWPTRITDEMDAKSLTLVVVFLGPNDPWDMMVEGKRHVFPSPGWALHYALRVDEVVAAAVERKVRVIWIGLPSMREGRVRDGAILQNHIFHARAKNWGTDYLATEPLIGTLSEPFKKFKPQEGGQSVNFRAEDGIHMTPSGLRVVKQALLEHIEKAAQP